MLMTCHVTLLSAKLLTMLLGRYSCVVPTLVSFSRKAANGPCAAAWSAAHDFTRALFKPNFDNAAAIQLQNPVSGRSLAKASFVSAETRSDAISLGRITVQPFWQLPRHLFFAYIFLVC